MNPPRQRANDRARPAGCARLHALRSGLVFVWRRTTVWSSSSTASARYGADLAPLAEPLSAFLPSTAFAAPDAPEPFNGGGPARQWFSIAGVSPRQSPAAGRAGARRFRPRRFGGDRRARLRRPARPRRPVRLLSGRDHGARRDRRRALAGRSGRRRFRPAAGRRRADPPPPRRRRCCCCMAKRTRRCRPRKAAAPRRG